MSENDDTSDTSDIEELIESEISLSDEGEEEDDEELTEVEVSVSSFDSLNTSDEIKIVSDRIIGFAEPSVRFSRKLSAEPNNRFPTEPSVWANKNIFIFSGTYRGGNSPGILGVTPKIIIHHEIFAFSIAY